VVDEVARTADHVSVVLPYFNRADCLERAAASVLSQTYRELSLYLVNDGSTDGSRAVARGLRDERVVHIDAPGNVGSCAARNLGIEAARSDLVAFMDSDDEWFPEKLETQVAHLRTAQEQGDPVAVVGCGWRYSDSAGPSKDFDAGPFDRVDILNGRVGGVGTPMLLVDRQVAAATAVFDTLMPALQDRDYVLSCIANGSLVAVVPQALAAVTRGRSDHVANNQRAAAAWERLIAKYGTELRNDRALWAWYHYRAARQLFLAGEVRRGVRHVRPALARDPMRKAVHLALTGVARSKGAAVAGRLVPYTY
jgi:glycosyltransferase involved in cell wall biosynthesis